MISKLLDHPITIPILMKLSKKPLTIPQILNSLEEDVENSTIFAILVELYYFGLIEQFNKAEKENLPQGQKEIQTYSKNIQNITLRTHKTTLGVPLKDYISLWEDVQQKSNEKVLEELDNLIFYVPDQLAEIFINCTPDEIRIKLLKISS